MPVTVMLFGAFREAVGASQVRVEARKVGELLKALAEAHPVLHGQTMLVAVNQELVSDPEHPIHPGDEVAVFPPVGGG